MGKDRLEWDAGKWLNEANVRILSLAGRGFWFDILNYMHQNGRTGRLEATIPQLARLVSCTEQEAHSCLNEIKTSKTADVNDCDGVVTIVNRRMLREHIIREQTKERVDRHRGKEHSQDEMFDGVAQPEAVLQRNFDVFWSAYPRKVSKEQAWGAFQKLSKTGKLPALDKLLLAIQQQKRTEQWVKDGGVYIPYPSSWLNQARWDDVSDGSVLSQPSSRSRPIQGNF